jgi:hypothetical protein
MPLINLKIAHSAVNPGFYTFEVASAEGRALKIRPDFDAETLDFDPRKSNSPPVRQGRTT